MQHTATALCPAAQGWRKSAPLPVTAVTAAGHRAAESSVKALCCWGLTTRFLETQAFRVTEVVGGGSWFSLTPLQPFPSALRSPVDVQSSPHRQHSSVDVYQYHRPVTWVPGYDTGKVPSENLLFLTAA